MTVETTSFYQLVDDLIERASGILLPHPLLPIPLKEVALYQKFLDQASGQKGHTDLWVMRNGFRRLRVSATSTTTVDEIPPTKLDAAVDAPYTVLRLRVGSPKLKIANALFRRSNYPDEVNLKVWGPKAIQPAGEYLALLKASLVAGTLTFPTQ